MNKNDQNDKGSCYTMMYFFPRITKIRHAQGPIDTTTRQIPNAVVSIAHTIESIEHKDTTTRQGPDVVVPIEHTTKSIKPQASQSEGEDQASQSEGEDQASQSEGEDQASQSEGEDQASQSEGEDQDTTTRQRPDVLVPIAHTTESMGTTGYKSKRRCQDQDHISVDYPVSKACCKGFVKLTDFSCYTRSLMIDKDVIVTKTRNETGFHISIKKLKFQMFSLDDCMHEPFFERQPLK